jgi:predicted N-acetyltransferase YhbS
VLKRDGFMKIRNSIKSDRSKILHVHKQAFGGQKGVEIANLVDALFHDETAIPVHSLVATKENKIIGHILFTTVTIAGTEVSFASQILAPLAIHPESQKQGVGQKLINRGIRQLRKAGVGLVFVLGHPDYYPKCGFVPAGAQGFEAPYPIPEEHANAWMVQELQAGVIGSVSGKVRCANMLDKPEHWRE